MSYHALFLAPLALFVQATGSVEAEAGLPGATTITQSDIGDGDGDDAATGYAAPSPESAAAATFPEGSPFRLAAAAFGIEAANQVRIEQQMTIRITPRPQPARPNMLLDLPDREIGPRFLERNIGKCVKASGIAGVQPGDGNRLLLFMRDRRVVSAQLERACRSRDFYSGFYLSRSNDGQLCVDRDTLLSRSGANCKLTRMRQLIETDP